MGSLFSLWFFVCPSVWKKEKKRKVAYFLAWIVKCYTGVNDSAMGSLHIFASHYGCQYFSQWWMTLYWEVHFCGFCVWQIHSGAVNFFTATTRSGMTICISMDRPDAFTLEVWIFTLLWMVLEWKDCIFINRSDAFTLWVWIYSQMRMALDWNYLSIMSSIYCRASSALLLYVFGYSEIMFYIEIMLRKDVM